MITAGLCCFARLEEEEDGWVEARGSCVPIGGSVILLKLTPHATVGRGINASTPMATYVTLHHRRQNSCHGNPPAHPLAHAVHQKALLCGPWESWAASFEPYDKGRLDSSANMRGHVQLYVSSQGNRASIDCPAAELS